MARQRKCTRNIRRQKRIDRILRRMGARCFYCGKPLTKGQHGNRSLDHLIPRSRGGTNEDTNLVPCCRYCNVAKGDMLPLEYIRHLNRSS